MADFETELPDVIVTGKRLSSVGFSISDFKNNIGNIVRPNLFVAEFEPGPKFANYLSTIDSEFIERFPFRCEVAEFPGKSLATTEDTGGAGPTLKLPYDVTFNDINMTIICAEDMKERQFFESWMDSIVAPVKSKSISGLVNFYENYAEGNKLSISQLDAKATNLITFSMYDIYPVAISPMTASWEETNTYQRFSVTMTYRYYQLHE